MPKSSLLISFLAVIALFGFQIHLVQRALESANAEFDHLVAIRTDQLGQELEQAFYCFQSEAQQFVPGGKVFYLMNPLEGAGMDADGNVQLGTYDTLVSESQVNGNQFTRYGFNVDTRVNMRFDFEFIPIDLSQSLEGLNPMERYILEGYRHYVLDSDGLRLVDTLLLDSLVNLNVKTINGAENLAYQLWQGEDLIFQKGAISPETFSVSAPGNLYKSRLLPSLKMVLYFPDRSLLMLKNQWPILLAILGLSALLVWLSVRSFQLIKRMTELNELKSDFINMMTHEFNTPITNLKLTLDHYHHDLPTEKKDKLLTIINTEIDRIRNNIKTLFEINKLSTNELALEKGHCQVHELLRMTGDVFEAGMAERNAATTWSLDASNDLVWVDKVHLLNVFTNLIDNSLKYSFTAPRLAISTNNTPQCIAINFKDEGSGMTKEQLKHVFEKYYRSDQLEVKATKGMGMGLYYVNKIVGLHGGSIDIKSQPDQGTTVTILLPNT